MGKQESVIKLLMIEDSVEDAEQVISVLRNGGVAVRPSRAEDADQLAQAIENQPLDIILVNLDAKSLRLKQVTEALSRSGKDVSVLGVAAELTESIVLQAYRDGARAMVMRGRSEHLQIVVKREFESLSTRRAVRRLEASLREIERRCDSLLDSSRDPIAYVHEGMHVRANKAYLEMFGYPDFEELQGMAILDMIAADDADDFKALLKKLSKGEPPPERLHLKAQRADGSTFPAVMEFSAASYEGEHCQQIILRQQQTAINEAELEALRSKDLVTDLFNRPYMLAQLDQVVASATTGKHDLALLLIETDNFKSTLDTVGLGNADLLLGDMASLLRKYAAPSDTLARFTEQTFAVLRTSSSNEATKQFAETLRKAFEERIFEVGNKSVNVTVSIGGVLIGEKIANAEAILGQSSNSLRAAQAEGGNRISLFDPAAQDKADEERDRHWLHLVKEALVKDGFLLFYQPIISLHGAEGEFYEILLRLQGPKGEIGPGFFLPVAERNNLLPQIDRWVISHAIRSVAEREKAGHKTTFFIKITSQTLEDQTMLPWLAQQLKTARLRGDALVFEMPESKVVTNLKHVRYFQKGLEQLHCAFALEQFGSGLNSFQLLKHVDANYLKVDRTFMAELPKNKENQVKVKEICDQAHHLGKQTVAEFVEDAASMSILFSCGVNFVQGNFLQEPIKVMAYDVNSG